MGCLFVYYGVFAPEPNYSSSALSSLIKESKRFMPYINKGEVLKETPPFQRTMNFNSY